MRRIGGGGDRRRAPWLPSRNRYETFECLEALAQRGLNRPQIANALGTTDNALSCYMRRQGITMAELRGEEDCDDWN